MDATPPFQFSVFGAAKLALRSAVLSIVHMPAAFGATVLMVVALAFVRGQLPPSDQSGSLVDALFDDVLLAIVVAPMVIAVHRYILLGERSRFLPIDPLRRVVKFASWIVAIYATTDLAIWIFGTLRSSVEDQPAGVRIVFYLMYAAAMIAGFVVTLRLSLIFPAIAIDSPESAPSSIWKITDHNFFRIFAVGLVAALALALLAAIVFGIYSFFVLTDRFGPMDPSHKPSTDQTVSYLLSMLDLIVAASVASWLFKAFEPTGAGDR